LKLLSRITALTVLASPVLLGQPAGRESAAPPEFPFRRPVSPEGLGAKGVLRFSISRDSLRSFTESAGSSELDYDLLRRFASDLNAGLEARVQDTPLDAARQLEAGMVDVAVLPADFETREGLVSTDPCPEPVARQTEPVRVAAFLRSDSRFLAELLSSASRRIADAGLSESIPPLYCSPSRFDEKPVEPELPKSRRISRYAPTIAKYAGAAGFDWRLVAALIFQESSFEERAVSVAGAQGLMQLMPGAWAEVGMANTIHPEANIRAGVLYLRRLSNQFREAESSDRLALVLAAYFLGPGHVFDAQDLARQLGLNSSTWRRGLEETLPLLEDPRFHAGTRLGFAHGRKAVDYVNRILERYEVYRQRLDRHPEMRAGAERTRGDA
jgi:membrane-bound lytic murein transglycosylase MltF